MTQKKIPMTQEELIAAGQAAMQPAIQPSASGQFVKFTRNRRVKKRNQQGANLWLWSPGTLYFSKTSEWALTDNAKARGVKLDDEFVKRIAIGHYDTEPDTIYIYATAGNDPDGFDLNRDRQLTANVADYFFSHGLVRPAGVKEKFDLLPAPKTIDGLPALCIYLNKATDKGTFETTRKKKKDDENNTK